MAQDRQFSWRRSLAWAVSLAVHLSLIVAMTVPSKPVVPEAIVDVAAAPAWVPVDVPDAAGAKPRTLLVIPVGERAPPTVTSAPSERVRTERPLDAAQVDPAVPRAEPSVVGASVASTAASEASVPVARAIAYLDDEARARLPQENLYSASPPPREGDYYTPGNGTEDDVFYRPRALDPNPSRFAHAWRPRGSLIDDWLGRLMDKATGEVSIPLNPKFSLVCRTVAGIAGGCTIVRNGGTGVIVQRPPPAPWDRSNRVQCRELREALDGADEAAEVAYYLDRLSALCGGGDVTDAARPEGGAANDPSAGNDEARRETGLLEAQGPPRDAPANQRVL